jgi:hypothetical protein
MGEQKANVRSRRIHIVAAELKPALNSAQPLESLIPAWDGFCRQLCLTP